MPYTRTRSSAQAGLWTGSVRVSLNAANVGWIWWRQIYERMVGRLGGVEHHGGMRSRGVFPEIMSQVVWRAGITQWLVRIVRTTIQNFAYSTPRAVILTVTTTAVNPLQALQDLTSRAFDFPPWVDITSLRYFLIIHPSNSPLSDPMCVCVHSHLYTMFNCSTIQCRVSLQCCQEAVWTAQLPTSASTPHFAAAWTSTCPNPSTTTAKIVRS